MISYNIDTRYDMYENNKAVRWLQHDGIYRPLWWDISNVPPEGADISETTDENDDHPESLDILT